MSKQLRLKSLDEVKAELNKLEKAGSPKTEGGGWSAAQVLIHCAQSIEYSLTGYPSNKSALFRGTVGRLVLRKFLKQGFMSHNLEAPVPNAPELPATATLAEGLTRLRKAIADFQAAQGEPAPHFAYGPVTRAQYDQIHAFHVANHLAEIPY